jgi:hypothetical protein
VTWLLPGFLATRPVRPHTWQGFLVAGSAFSGVHPTPLVAAMPLGGTGGMRRTETTILKSNYQESAMRLAALFYLASLAGFAGSWEGVLVNSECYDTVERNVNPFESGLDASRDRNFEVRYCRANMRTKSFAVVQPDGQSFKLDRTGNVRAAEIVRKGNQKVIFVVDVIGKVRGRLIEVDSISMLRNVAPR